MTQRRFALTWLTVVVLLLGLTGMSDAATPTLSLVPSKTEIPQGETFTLDIEIDNPTGVAGCAFTLEYPADRLSAPTPNADGAVTTISSVFFQNFQSTRVHRENTSKPGEILFSGANINPTTGGGPYTVSNMILFTVPFAVKIDAPLGEFTFTLKQTVLLNPDAGWGSGTTPAPTPVLVGAVPKIDPNWTDLAKAFPVLLGDDIHPFTPVTSAAVTVIPPDNHRIFGTVSYSGRQTGTLYVSAFKTSDTSFTTPIGAQFYPWGSDSTSKAFTLSVPNGSYYLAAFIDPHSTGYPADSWDAQGEYKTIINIANADDTTSRNFSLSDPDTDQDTLPDYWEMSHFGSLSHGPTTDYDQDGYTQTWEYKNRTNPKQQDPPFTLLGFDVSTDNRKPYQVVSTSPENIMVPSGGSFVLSVNYDVTDKNNTLSGLDISIHFDSTKLDYNAYTDFLDVGNLKSPPNLLNDTANEDKDTTTDKRINMSWASFTNEWPKTALPVVLAKLNFTLKKDVDLDETPLNVSVFDYAPNYSFAGIGATVTRQEWSLDIDGNVEAKPLTDGLLAIRYLFRYHLAGPTWIEGLVASNATRKTSAEIETYLANAVDNLILDIDGNGEAKPLTDGLLLVRYLFRYHLAGPTWIEGIVASNATRKTAAEIEGYLSAIMPLP